MSEKQTTTYWGDNPIALAAKARTAELDWINASRKLDKAKRAVARAQEEYDAAFRHYTGVNPHGDTSGR